MIIDDVQKERECQKVVGAEQLHRALFLRVLLQAISFICSIIFNAALAFRQAAF